MVLTNDINTIIVTSAMDIAAITAAKHEIIVIFVPILIDLFNVKNILSYIISILRCAADRAGHGKIRHTADFMSEVIIT